MTQAEQKIERFQELVGVDISYHFEKHVASAIVELADSLHDNFLDNDTKVNYATHVFAKMLDDLADMLENNAFLN